MNNSNEAKKIQKTAQVRLTSVTLALVKQTLSSFHQDMITAMKHCIDLMKEEQVKDVYFTCYYKYSIYK